MNDEIHAILAEAEGLRHLKDDECFRLGEAVIKAASALNDEERQELADAIKNHEKRTKNESDSHKRRGRLRHTQERRMVLRYSRGGGEAGGEIYGNPPEINGDTTKGLRA